MDNKTPSETERPEVTLLIGSGCSYCPVVLDACTRLLKEERIGRLDVINVTLYPEEAAKRGIRSVPWMEVGPYHLEGAHTYGDLLKWIDNTAAATKQADYFQHLLETGRIEPVIEQARQRTENRRELVTLLSRAGTPMAVHIGVGAVLEELSVDGLLKDIVDDMIELTESGDPKLRADACHYLGMSLSDKAVSRLEEILQHEEDPDVREIATESLAELERRTHPE